MVLVIVPAYNEEEKIGRVIRGLFEQGLKNVVVVDDGSTDGTVAEAEKLGVKILRHEINRGQGAALETGNAYARLVNADQVVHFDADDQFNPADVLDGVSLMGQKNLDVVFGSRFIDERSKIPWLKRVIILPLSRWVNFVFTGCLLSDAHNGFRILSKNALGMLHITHDRMAHNTEIVRQVKKFHLRYAEFPVEVKYHTYGQGVGGGFMILRDLIVGLFTRLI